MIVARDLAHAKLRERLEKGQGLPDYFKNHPVYYAGPAKTPAGYASGAFGPTTAGRMDSFVADFQKAGGSMVMLAKGNRSPAVTAACKQYGGFYLGSIGGVGGEPRRALHQEGRDAWNIPSSAWRRSGGSRWSISRPSSWSTTRATTSSRN